MCCFMCVGGGAPPESSAARLRRASSDVVVRWCLLESPLRSGCCAVLFFRPGRSGADHFLESEHPKVELDC